MYKVFLVEDEVVVREGIKNIIRWREEGFSFVGEATDGEVALPLILELKPDIVITDIKMPFMDGLELSEVIKKNMPWIKIVILSGHDEFEFAKKAISLGVNEYLLKPISSADLTKVLKKVASQIDEEKREKEGIEKIKSQMRENQDVLYNKFLSDLIYGNVSSTEALNKAEEFGINIIAKFYQVAIMSLSSVANVDFNSKILEAWNILEQVIHDDSSVITFKINIDKIVLIFKGDDAVVLENESLEKMNTFKSAYDKLNDVSYSIVIGEIKNRIKDISKSFSSANSILEYKYIYGRNKIMFPKEIKNVTEKRSDILNSADNLGLLKLENNKIAETLRYEEIDTAKNYLREYLNLLDDNDLGSILYRYYIFMDIIIIISKFVEEIGEDLDKVVPAINNIDETIVKLDSINVMYNYLVEIMEKAMTLRDNKSVNKYKPIIKKAKDFIDANYADKNLSLKATAAYVNLSPSHFSSIFSQESGDTFVEYLTKIRINKAMEQLKCTNNRSSEIAFNVGYKDPHYFSFIFKKVTGLTPKEFRNEGRGRLR